MSQNPMTGFMGVASAALAVGMRHVMQQNANNAAAMPPPNAFQPSMLPPSMLPPNLMPPAMVAPAPPQPRHPANKKEEEKEEDELPQSLEQQENMTQINKSETRAYLMQKLSQREPECKVMVLRNMVDAADVNEELKDEVTDECQKFGNVKRVIIYQEKQGEEDNAPIIVKIFVEYDQQSEVEFAISKFNGRFFAGRMITAEKYDQMMYSNNQFDGWVGRTEKSGDYQTTKLVRMAELNRSGFVWTLLTVLSCYNESKS